MKINIIIDFSHSFYKSYSVFTRMNAITDLSTEKQKGILIRKVVTDLCAAINKCSFSEKEVYFCFDGMSWRKDIYDDYKVGRGDKPTGFYECQEFVKEQLAERGYNTIKCRDGESDDCIALLCDILPGKKLVYSSDEDMQQLISKEVLVWNNNLKHSKLFCVEEDEIMYLDCDYEKVVINPMGILFKKVMLGCAMDEVSPLIDKKGIGEKTVLKAMNEYLGPDYELNLNMSDEEVENLEIISAAKFKYHRLDFEEKLSLNIELVKLKAECMPQRVLNQFLKSFDKLPKEPTKIYDIETVLDGTPYWKKLA